MITAGVPHGEETECVPPQVCQIQRRLFVRLKQSSLTGSSGNNLSRCIVITGIT